MLSGLLICFQLGDYFVYARPKQLGMSNHSSDTSLRVEKPSDRGPLHPGIV